MPVGMNKNTHSALAKSVIIYAIMDGQLLIAFSADTGH